MDKTHIPDWVNAMVALVALVGGMAGIYVSATSRLEIVEMAIKEHGHDQQEDFEQVSRRVEDLYGLKDRVLLNETHLRALIDNQKDTHNSVKELSQKVQEVNLNVLRLTGMKRDAREQ